MYTCNFFGKVHKEVIVLSCLGEGLGERIPIHIVSVVSHPKQQQNNNKELNKSSVYSERKFNSNFQTGTFEGNFILRAIFCEVYFIAYLNSCPELYCHHKIVVV